MAAGFLFIYWMMGEWERKGEKNHGKKIWRKKKTREKKNCNAIGKN